MRRDLLGNLQTAAIPEVPCNSRRPERVLFDLRAIILIGSPQSRGGAAPNSVEKNAPDNLESHTISSRSNVRTCVGPSQSRIISGSSDYSRHRPRSHQAVLRILHGSDPEQEYPGRILSGDRTVP
jgi:hypothetical protein